MVALTSARVSKIGDLYNEIPDRISDTAVFIGAGFAWGGNIALGYIATILAIFTAYVRAAGNIAGAPNEFCGRWQNNIGCSSSPSSAYTRQSRHVPGR